MPPVRASLVIAVYFSALARELQAAQLARPWSFLQARVAGQPQPEYLREEVKSNKTYVDARDKDVEAVWANPRLLNRQRHADHPWRKISGADTDGARTLCIDGKLVPELYVLGAQKAATSSLSEDLVDAGVESKGDTVDMNPKEFHFFDANLDWKHASLALGIENGRERWLKHLPDCTWESHRVLADFTPDSLRMVPVPKGIRASGQFPPWRARPSGEADMPVVLKTFYGAAAPRISFVTLLRSPLSRMQSAWYAAKACNNFGCICLSCKADSFHAALDAHLTRALSTGEVSDWIWASMYGPHLKRWLEVFSAKQMMVVPYKQYVEGDKDAICRDLFGRLRFAVDCASTRSASRAWATEKTELSVDAGELRPKFHGFMRPFNEELVSVLAQAHADGASLANFAGAREASASGSEEARDSIKKWLFKSW